MDRFSKHKSLIGYATLVIAITISLFVAIDVMHKKNAFSERLQETGKGYASSFDLVEKQGFNSLQALATFVASDSTVQELFYRARLEYDSANTDESKLADIRNLLWKRLYSGWQGYQRNFRARQLHFHFPPAVSFFRLHKPNKYGDDLSDVRHSVVAANSSLKVTTGFESGRVYSGLRAVVPVFYNLATSGESVHVGSVEVGMSYDPIIEQIDDKFDIGIAVLLDKAHLKDAMWQDSIEQNMYARLQDSCNCFIEASSRPGIVDMLYTLSTNTRMPDLWNQTIEVTHENKTYAVTLIPVNDFKAKYMGTPAVGTLVFWDDVSVEKSELNNGIFLSLAYGLAGFLIIEFLFLIVLKLSLTKLQMQIERQTEAISKNEARLLEAQRISKLGTWEYDHQNGKLTWSERMYSLFDIEMGQEHPSYQRFLMAVHQDDRERVNDHFKKPYANREYRLNVRGGIRYVNEHYETQFDVTGEPLTTVGTLQDVSKGKENQQKIDLASKVFFHVKEGIIITDSSGTIIDINNAFSLITGYSRSDAIGQNASMLSSGKQSNDFYKEMWQQLEKTGYWEGELWNARKNGEVYPQSLVISATDENQYGEVNYVGLFSDVSDKKRMEQALLHDATHDPLTGLPNRQLLYEHLDESIELANKYGDEFLLVFIDLDGFKPINDQYGHAAGDKVLVEIGSRLLASCRNRDFVARIGGDEFVIVFDSRLQREYTERVLLNLLETIRQPINIDIAEVKVSCSIGGCRMQNHHTRAEIIARADSAMYQAKERGRNCFVLCDKA